MKSYLELQQRRQEFVIIILFHKFKFSILHMKLVNEIITIKKRLHGHHDGRDIFQLGSWELWIALLLLQTNEGDDYTKACIIGVESLCSRADGWVQISALPVSSCVSLD